MELLGKLQLKSLAALSAASGTSADSDSDASTVKNVPLKMNSPGGQEVLCIDFIDNNRIIVGQRKWKVQNMQFHKDLDSAKHVSSKVEFALRGAGHIHVVLWVDWVAFEVLHPEKGKLVWQC